MYPRFAAAQIEQALTDTRVVLLAGPRQAGKTTLAQSLADGSRRFQTLDNATALAAATRDPTGFVRALDRAVIDEIQRARPHAGDQGERRCRLGRDASCAPAPPAS